MKSIDFLRMNSQKPPVNNTHVERRRNMGILSGMAKAFGFEDAVHEDAMFSFAGRNDSILHLLSPEIKTTNGNISIRSLKTHRFHIENAPFAHRKCTISTSKTTHF